MFRFIPNAHRDDTAAPTRLDPIDGQTSVNPALATQVAVTFTWLGLVLGISFLEAPLKFRAPGLSVEVGVGIGRLVFRALNIVEGIAAVVLLVAVLLQGAGDVPVSLILVIAAIVVLGLGALVVRPLMDRRVTDGRTAERMPRHTLHFAYIALEVLKVALLVSIGVTGLAAA
ncbi:hypothetical protein GCM10028798_23310 [Humibacter antri]